MICPNGHTVADPFLTCPVCATERGEKAFLELQFEFLRRTARHEFGYHLRVAKLPEKHVMMFSSFTRTFCGKELDARPKISYEHYNDDAMAKVCAGCRIGIARLMEDAVE